MSVAPAGAPAVPGAPAPGTGSQAGADACPLCGTPLHPAQEWCLRCGAAARTRLSATPNWRRPTIAAALLMALVLGALAAALVKVAADSGPPPPATTRTVTTQAPVGAPAPPAVAAPAPSAPVVGATAPGATTAPLPAGANAPAAGSLAPARTTPTITTPTPGTRTRRVPALSPAAQKRLQELNLAGALK